MSLAKFKHELNVFFGGDISIYLETSLNGTTWTTQYSDLNVPNDINATTQNVDISSLDGNTTIYLRFRMSGDTFDFFDCDHFFLPFSLVHNSK